MLPFSRPDYRKADELRLISAIPHIAPNADGSILISFGNTKVICAANLIKGVPKWMLQQNVSGGWITAEYSMLPYSTLERKDRDVNRGKVDGRTMEIQRLIGRAIRSVCDLSKLEGYTLWIDCDVLQADGSTRCASISGAYIASQLAIHKHLKKGSIKSNPFKESVAAVSAGIYLNTPIVDLNFIEDKNAQVDANIIMTSSHQLVEVQSSGEETTFSQDQLLSLLSLSKNAIDSISAFQKNTLDSLIK